MSHTTECRYPCGCDQFPEDHCACMDGHTAPDPTPGEVGLSEAEQGALRTAIIRAGYRGDHEVLDVVERILAARTAAPLTVRDGKERPESSHDARGYDRRPIRRSAYPKAADREAKQARTAEAQVAALRATVERVEALVEECASSSCIHLNDLYARLRAALGGEHDA